LRKKLADKIRESLASVVPITLIVLLLTFCLCPVELGTLSLFFVGAVALIFGMGLFTLGADMSMMPMGSHIGAFMTRKRDLRFLGIVALVMGVLITVAEPDLAVLAHQVPSVPDAVLIWSVAIGVGLFLVLAVLRIVFQKSLSLILIILYGILFALSFFIPQDFFAVAFDSGGVTTGPITVPFILSLGVGVAAVHGGKGGQDDSFGLVSLCSVGPILAVMILSLLYPMQPTQVTETVVSNPGTTHDLLRLFGDALPHYFQEVGVALAPIVILFGFFQIKYLKLPASQVLRMAVGVVYTYLGLVLFLTGVNVGFMPLGNLLGSKIAAESYRWLLVPLGMVIGYFIVKAEPAVHVLNEQVEEISGGTVSRDTMMKTLSIGMAISVGLSMLRVVTGINLQWFLLPGYALALILTFFVPKIFTAIAFDSGGVASGPMTATFLLPLAMGACQAVGGNVMTDAFGIVAMVAMTPLIAIQLLGLVYKLKSKRNAAVVPVAEDDEVIEL